MMCDEAGRAWMQEFSLADDPIGLGRRWYVHEGARRVATVAFPASFRPRVIASDDVYGIHVDALDQQRVALIPLPAELRARSR